MTPHLAFDVHEASQVGEVRRRAAELAQAHGFDDVASGRLALVVNELGHNLVRHAREGRLLVGWQGDLTPACVEVIAIDRGPGIADVSRCLQDGYSTGGTPGSGLGAIQRMAESFDIFSQSGVGSVMVARVAASSQPRPLQALAPEPVEVAGFSVAAPGEHVSGDSWGMCLQGSQGRLLMADGLGHGPDAAVASDQAVAVFQQQEKAQLVDLVDRAHVALRGTRGAALAVLDFDADARTVSICGAGNITGRIVSGTEDRTLVTQHGTVGLQIRRTQAMNYTWDLHALLVLHSDGIATRWNLKDVPGLLRCRATVIAAWIFNLHGRGRDDATIVVARRQE